MCIRDRDKKFINENFDEAEDMIRYYDIEGVLITIAKAIASYGYDEEYIWMSLEKQLKKFIQEFIKII